ncbi:hypothetical protein Bca52824_067494 [Brassica carinata]|uniref:Uncharacterized protein n=1 Tax=Brassica carinata TaxID=52824 RepID=A0A8X7UBX6_BRACI|nr:hypothetical protein Bca52824_067494 [Brassica carinata]
MMASRIASPSFSSFLALMVTWIEFCERKLDTISLKSSNFLSERNNLAVFTCSLATGAFVSILISVLRTSPTIGMISSLGFILYMHFLVDKIWWSLLLNRDEYPRRKRFRNLYALGKTVLQTFVLHFIILLGDLVSNIEDVSFFLVLGFALMFLHLILLSKFFYMLEDFGLLDGVFTLFFGTLTHSCRSPLGQFLVMLFAYLVLLALHLRYSPCCEENHAKKEEERRSREEAEKIAKEKDEEEQRKAREEEVKRKAAEEVVKRARAEAKKATEALVKARDEAQKARDEVKKASDEVDKAREKKEVVPDDEKLEAEEEFDKTSKKADEAREREAEAIKEEEKARERVAEALGELEKLRRGR